VRRTTWLPILLFAMTLPACGLLDSPEKQLHRAEAALEGGRFGEAVVTLRSLAESKPDRAEVLLLLARALFLQGAAEEARGVLQKAEERGASPQSVAAVRAEWLVADNEFAALGKMAEDGSVPFDDMRRQYYLARSLQGLRRIPEALSIYLDLLKTQPASPDLYLRIAQSHLYHDRVQLAQAALDKALDLPPPAGETRSQSEAWLLKAELARRAGDLTAASQAFDKALEAAPRQFGVVQQSRLISIAAAQALRSGDLARAREYHGRLAQLVPQALVVPIIKGQIELAEDHPDAAVGPIQRLAQQNPDNPTVRALLIAALVRTGSLELALREANALVAQSKDAAYAARIVELLRSASALPTGTAERSLALATTLSTLDQPILAHLELEGALARDPELTALEVALVQLEVRSGRLKEALARASKVAEAHPDSEPAHVLHAEVLSASNDFSASAAIYEQLWKRRPSGPLALSLAQARVQAGKLADASEPLAAWLRNHPADFVVRHSLAAVLQQAGRLEDATKEFEGVATASPSAHPLRVVALNNLAVLYGKKGDPRALRLARMAYEGGKSVPAIQDTYGWLLVQHDNLKEGLPLLESAAEAMPGSAETRYHLAFGLARAGRRGEARALLTDVLRTDAFEGRAQAEQLLATL
jgi:tetratricopeptide (TPR) repeat protein